jgi:hypothetical protein
VVDGSYRNFATRTILCAASLHEASTVIAAFAAEMAVQHDARLVLQHVIRPQERAEIMAGRTLDEIEKDLLMLVPPKLHHKIAIQTIVVPGDASAFAAITRHGVVYKVLAHAHCPVITLSPVVLAECGSKPEKILPPEAYMAGVF